MAIYFCIHKHSRGTWAPLVYKLKYSSDKTWHFQLKWEEGLCFGLLQAKDVDLTLLWDCFKVHLMYIPVKLFQQRPLVSWIEWLHLIARRMGCFLEGKVVWEGYRNPAVMGVPLPAPLCLPVGFYYVPRCNIHRPWGNTKTPMW